MLMYLVGYIQPEYVIGRLGKPDVDGLMSRHLIMIVERQPIEFEVRLF